MSVVVERAAFGRGLVVAPEAVRLASRCYAEPLPMSALGASPAKSAPEEATR